MPCYLFTYHAYGSWLPDRKRGYVKRGRGVLPTDAAMHDRYVAAMKELPIEFDEQRQRWLIAALLESESPQRFDLYYVATDATHVHGLLGWRDERGPVTMRSLIKGSLSRAMNRQGGRRTWLVEGGSRKQVKSGGHFAYLVTTYLPKHSGWKWDRERGLHR